MEFVFLSPPPDRFSQTVRFAEHREMTSQFAELGVTAAPSPGRGIGVVTSRRVGKGRLIASAKTPTAYVLDPVKFCKPQTPTLNFPLSGWVGLWEHASVSGEVRGVGVLGPYRT